MFFRTPRFIRRWFRRRMHPMAEHKALSIREKLSLVYAFFAWNAGGFVLYQIFCKDNVYWSVTEGLATKEEMEMKKPAYYYAKTLGINEAEVMRVSLTGKVRDVYEIKIKEDQTDSENIIRKSEEERDRV